jgi:hypothetical protein
MVWSRAQVEITQSGLISVFFGGSSVPVLILVMGSECRAHRTAIAILNGSEEYPLVN